MLDALAAHALPALVAVALWWGGTALVMRLDGRRPETFAGTMAAATVVLAVALCGLSASAASATVGGAYCAFACAVVVWGWVELSFLTGLITGARHAEAPPPGSALSRRFGAAVRAILHHEIALLAAAALVAALTWRGENHTGLWTVLLLWGMRTSAKLNLFLGVRQPGAELLPDHLRHLARHFGPAGASNPLLAVSVLASGAVAAALLVAAADPGASRFAETALTLLGTMAALGALEHALLAAPLVAPEALWGWGLRSREANPAAAAPTRPRVPRPGQATAS